MPGWEADILLYTLLKLNWNSFYNALIIINCSPTVVVQLDDLRHLNYVYVLVVLQHDGDKFMYMSLHGINANQSHTLKAAATQS